MVKEANPPDRRDAVLGLALSGGGFRAAFFHIGVLAQMATLGLLRQVEVISTVSGGSIVGAGYYLHVKRLLERKPDAAITDDDYVEIVDQLAQSFLAGVQQNLRARTFTDLRSNFRMGRPNYSRSDRIGELYDRYFYDSFRSSRGDRIKMRDLLIGDFDPARDNPTRRAKIPILLLNATVLNDGHVWRFEAVRMGERKRPVPESRIDMNLVLGKPPSYAAVVPTQQDFPLGAAVAASACFPAFPPLAISGLYPGMRLQLVDGGVYDNQGVHGLEYCTVRIVSDGSGQMRDEHNPTGSTLGALLRDASIEGDRIREEELFQLDRDPNAAVLHLRKGLTGMEVPWIGADGQPVAPMPTPGPAMLSFGVHRDVQDLLSAVRTDLDCFSETEAFSLMCDAYNQSGEEFPANAGIHACIDPLANQPDWSFLTIAPWLATPTTDFLRELRIAKSRFFKAPRLNRWLWLWFAVPLAMLGAILWLLWQPLLTQPLALGWILIALVLLLILVLLPTLSHALPALQPLSGPLDAVIRRTLWTLFPLFPWLIARAQLLLFDPAFRARGRVARLSPP